MPKPIDALALACLSLMTLLCACGRVDSRGPHAAPAEERGPHPLGVVLILVDTLRADHVGAYGCTRGLTPAIDALAAESLVFGNTWAASSWTRSSVASILTSRYPTSIGVLEREDALPGSVSTLAEIVAAEGFTSHGICTNGNAGSTWGFDQGFDSFVVPETTVSYPDDFPMIPAEAVTASAVEWLEAKRDDTPFLLYLHYTDPHDPYLPHPGLLGEPEPEGRFDGSRRDLRELDRLPPDEVTQADRDRIRYLYAGEVRYVDHWIGELLRELRRLDRYDESLVLLTSDHGEGLWDHGERAHGVDLHQEQTRVPLILKFPESFDVPPTRVDRPAGHTDIVPTILAAYGIPPVEGMQGEDLGQVLRRDRPAPEARTAYSEMSLDGRDFESVTDGGEKLIRCRAFDPDRATGRTHRVTTGDTIWSISYRYFGEGSRARDIIDANPALAEQGVAPRKVRLEIGTVLAIPDRVRTSGESLFELYDLREDPREQNDLIGGARAKRSPLFEALAAWARRIAEHRTEGRTVPLDQLDEETLEQLRGLGYIE